jgi:DNA mismatch repair protein MutS
VFGYFLEVTKTHLDKVPENYIRKQTDGSTQELSPE